MIADPEFFNVESDSPLLSRNNGFLSPGKNKKAIDRAMAFADLLNSNCATQTDGKSKELPDDVLRIFELDAQRTFSSPANRNNLVSTLSKVYFEIEEDYHQGLGFIVAYLLLFLPEDCVIKIVSSLHRSSMSGYFKAAPVTYVRDARVFSKILKEYFPSVHAKISPTVPPEAFCSKWFVGLNVHVLPFEALHLFLENFFSIGTEYLFKYSMSLINHCEQDLLKVQGAENILQVLRLDAKFYSIKKLNGRDSFYLKIVEDAVDFNLDDIDIEALRVEATEELAEEAEQRKLNEARLDDSDDEIIFSDEE